MWSIFKKIVKFVAIIVFGFIGLLMFLYAIYPAPGIQ